MAASTPTEPTNGSSQRLQLAATNGTTIYRGSMQGAISVGPLAANATVIYDGTNNPKVWTIHAELLQPLHLSDLINQFFRTFSLPDFLPGTLTVVSFSIDATVPSQSSNSHGSAIINKEPGLLLAEPAPKSSYKINGTIQWNVEVIPNSFTIQTKADIGLEYDDNREGDNKFSGSVIGMGKINLGDGGLDLTVMVGYRFGPATEDAQDLAILFTSTPASTHTSLIPITELLPVSTGDSRILWVEWEGIRASYDFNQKTITFSLKGWSVGRVIQALVQTIGDPYFTLPAPWNLLNQISLDGLSIIIDLNTGVQDRLSATYTLSSSIDLGILRIDGINFKRVKGKVTLAIACSTNIPGLQDSNLFKPESDGQNVQNMPSVPGRGNEYFKLYLLVMGQRIGIRDPQDFDSLQGVIKALEGVPDTQSNTNPVNPGNPQKGQPYYNPSNNWLMALHIGILRVGNIYTFEGMFVFNDPDLYGLRLAFNGAKAKVLAGLVIDILYKKIGDDVGVYQILFSFPSVLRNLDFGSFSIILPNIAIQIYTNGDFLIDFGFPYRLRLDQSLFSGQQVSTLVN
ncbi:MAG: hypothetical protein AB4062_20785 [Crocosphaera sp.]